MLPKITLILNDTYDYEEAQLPSEFVFLTEKAIRKTLNKPIAPAAIIQGKYTKPSLTEADKRKTKQAN